MDKWIGCTAIVTGASSGIGAAIAKKFLQNGINVVALGRRLELIEKLNEYITSDDVKLYPLRCDILDSEQIMETMEWIKTNVDPISILVNNAGIFNGSTNLLEGNVEVWRNTFYTNCVGLCIFTREVIKIMNEHDIENGLIINISSISAHYVPDLLPQINYNVNVYPSTKHAVKALSQTLRYELRNAKSKIRVSMISPGITLTEVFRTHLPEDMPHFATYPYMSTDDIADAALYILSTPSTVQVEDMIVRPVGEFL